MSGQLRGRSYRLLDGCCGAGGAAVGYHRAGFELIGVDVALQPLYPFEFVWADVLEFLDEGGAEGFDAIHVSPPCQRYSEGGRRYPEVQARHPDLIAPLRDRLIAIGLPYVIENVVGAKYELRDPVMVCARSLGLPRMARHRLFEASFPLSAPPCQCAGFDPRWTIGVYGDRPDGRRLNTRYPGARAARGLAEAHAAMGMDWADWHGTKEAVPPAYTEHIGAQLLEQLAGRVAEAA